MSSDGFGYGSMKDLLDSDKNNDFGRAVMDAMGRYYVARQGAEFIGGSVIPRLFPSNADRDKRKIDALDIMERRRRLGLPNDTAEYEEILNSDKPLMNPGRALTLGITATSSTSKGRLLNIGEEPFLKGFKNGSVGRGLGVIGKLFGK